MWGSPPRMRGKVFASPPAMLPTGITPAYAGKRRCFLSVSPERWDHPRVCGEKCISAIFAAGMLGSPPRMRGKACAICTFPLSQRITPAYAGKRQMNRNSEQHYRDHPRVCGEKLTTFDSGKLIPGSPPRMRGKEEDAATKRQAHGITPAYAGKRRCTAASVAWSWDHPRVCGEKLKRESALSPLAGSPPRMRGKVVSLPCLRLLSRITPAYAGKSHIFRNCGETG